MMRDDEFVELLWENDQPLIQQDQAKRARRSSSPTAPLPNLSQFKDDDEITTWDNYLTHLSCCSNIYTTDQYSEPGRVSTPELSQPLSPSSVPIHSKTYQGPSEALLQMQEPSPLSSSRMGVVKFSHYSRPPAVARATKHSISGMRSGEPASTSATVCGGASSNLVNPVIIEAGDHEFKGKKKGRGPKRTRAANVHNLSQRRRRARISEKITALQELIPNCNKVDKASILEEVIKYLKTLQLQLQMMYIRIRLFNPLMIPPTGMQLSQMPTMPPFSPMETGIGMGTGTGFSYGMGMYDSSNVQHLPVPPMQEQFAPGLMGMQASYSFPIYGMLGQGLSVPMPMPVFPPS